MALKKPPSIANDAFKSAKWDEITKDRNFSQADIPVIALLCQWYAVIQRCTDDIDEANGQVAFMNDMGDLKALPQINIMKQASAEIRALNKQLGINDEVKPSETKKKASVISVVQGKRSNRSAKAAN